MKFFLNIFFSLIIYIFCYKKKIDKNFNLLKSKQSLFKKRNQKKKKRKKYKGNEILLSANFSLSNINKNITRKRLFKIKKKKLKTNSYDESNQILKKKFSKIHPDDKSLFINSKLFYLNNKSNTQSTFNFDLNENEFILKTAKLNLFKDSNNLLRPKDELFNKKRAVDINDNFKRNSLSFLNYLALAIIIFLIILQLLSVIFPIQRKKLKRKLRLKPENFFKKRDYLDNFTKDTSNLKNILKSKKKKLKSFISKSKYKKLSDLDVQLFSKKNNFLEIDKDVNENKEIKNNVNIDIDNNKKENKNTNYNSKKLIAEKNFDKNQLNLKTQKLNNDQNQANSNKKIFEEQKKYADETKFKDLIEDKKIHENLPNQNNQIEFENQSKHINDRLDKIVNSKNEFNDQLILKNEFKESPAKQLKKITENKNNSKLINSEEKKIVSCEVNSYKVQNKDLSFKKDKFHEPEEIKISFKEEKIIKMIDKKNLNNVSDKILSSSNEQKVAKDFDSKLNYCNKLNDNEINLKSKTDNKIFPIKKLTETNNLDDVNRFVEIDHSSSKLSENLIKNNLNIKENTEKYFLIENSKKNLLTNNDLNKFLTRDSEEIYSDLKFKKNNLEGNDLKTRDTEEINLEKYNLEKSNKKENNSIDTLKEFKNIKTNSKRIQDINDSQIISINETFSNKKDLNKNLVEAKNTFTKNKLPKFSKIPISWKIEVNGKNQIAEDTIDLEKNEDCNVFRLKLPSAIFDLQNQSEKC